MIGSIAHYDILGLAGDGDLGPVYRARDTKAGRTVAVRVLSRSMSDPLVRARALDLIQPYTGLSHPHVATLFEAGEQQGAVYLVYEFVPGDTLSALIGGRPMNPRRALDLAAQVADALAEAHALELVHGDLRPSTVIVTPKGHPKILDFGLRAFVAGSGPASTADLQAARLESLGSARVAYMAPEQLLGQPADHRADLFSLGAILHEMVTGARAFSGRTAVETGVQVLQARPPIPSALNPDLPPELDAVVTRALSKKAADRYQSAALMAAELRSAASALQRRAAAVNEAKAPPMGPPSPWRAIALGCLLLAAIALGLWHWQDPIRQAWRGRFGRQPAPLLVVLPFQVVGTDLSRPYYGAGFADDLARQLGHIPGVTMMGRSTIRAFEGKSPQAAAASVGANVAVTGTLTPSDEEWTSLQIQVLLIGGRDGRVIWTASYGGAAQDVVALQARATRDVAAWLRVAYEATAAHGRASLRLVDPAAYDKYLQARDAMASNDASRAAQLFESAATADPSLLEAQAGLVEALYTMSAFEGRVQYGDVQGRARDAAEAAFAADPDLASTQFAMGLAADTYRQSLTHLRRAIEIDRSYTGAYLAIADVLREFDPARGNRFTQRAIDVDPMQPLAYYELAENNLVRGEFDAALIETARGQAFAPSLPWWDAMRLRVRMARPAATGSGAAPAGRDAGDFPPGIILRAADVRGDRRGDDAQSLLASLARLHPGSCEAQAMMAAVSFQNGRQSDASRLASDTLAGAGTAGAHPGWARCAVMAAAGVNDARRAAAILARVAASDRELRLWGTVNAVLSGRAGFRQRVFPWGNVAEAPAMIDALARLDAALVRARGDAAKVLDGL
jgi:TolB-like protein